MTHLSSEQKTVSMMPLLITGLLNPVKLSSVQSLKQLPLIRFNPDLINRVLSHSVRRSGEQHINPNLVSGVSQIFKLYDLFYSGAPLRQYLQQDKHIPGALDRKAKKGLMQAVDNLSQFILNGADILYATHTGQKIGESQSLNSKKIKGHTYDSSLKFLKDLREIIQEKPEFLNNVFHSLENLVTVLQQEQEHDLVKVLSQANLHSDFFHFITRFSQTIKDTLVAVIGKEHYTRSLQANFVSTKTKDRKTRLKIPSGLLPIVGVIALAIILGACGPAPSASSQEVVANAQSTAQAVWDQKTFEFCAMQSNASVCYEAMENPLSVPDAAGAAEQAAKSYAVSNGITLDPRIIEAVKTSQKRYQQWGGIITDIYSSMDDGTFYGWDFSTLPKESQYDMLDEVVTKAEETDTRVILDIGHGGVYSPCPAGTLCVAMDPVSTAPGYIYEEEDVGATGWFKLLLDKISASFIGSRADEVIYRLPHTIKHQDISQLTALDQMFDIRLISTDAVSTLKPGGYYVVIISSSRPSDADTLSDYLTENLNPEEFEIFNVVSLAEAQEKFSGQIQALRGVQRSAWPNVEDISRAVIVRRK